MKRILLIDDNTYDYSLLVTKLRPYDIEVHWAISIFHGQLILKSFQNFDLVVCDVMGIGANTVKDFDFLDREKTLITSSTFTVVGTYDFVTKDDLVEGILKKLGIKELTDGK